MLNKNDIALLRGMFQEQDVKTNERFEQQETRFDRKLDERFEQQETRFDRKLDERFERQEVRFDQKLEDQAMNLEDKLRSCIKATETTMMRKMEELKEEILDGVSDIVGNEILPQIDEHTREIGIIKRHLQLA